ncbi:MAG: hypothetical protein ACWA5Q_02470 [bacterium]
MHYWYRYFSTFTAGNHLVTRPVQALQRLKQVLLNTGGTVLQQSIQTLAIYYYMIATHTDIKMITIGQMLKLGQRMHPCNPTALSRSVVQ